MMYLTGIQEDSLDSEKVYTPGNTYSVMLMTFTKCLDVFEVTQDAYVGPRNGKLVVEKYFCALVRKKCVELPL